MICGICMYTCLHVCFVEADCRALREIMTWPSLPDKSEMEQEMEPNASDSVMLCNSLSFTEY